MPEPALFLIVANMSLFRYWGTSETLLPVYQSVEKACEKHPEVDTVGFAGLLE